MILSIVMLSAIACTPAAAVTQLDPAIAVTENGDDVIDIPGNGQLDPATTVDPNSPLTDAEIAGLLFMREEEKLAGDVYRALNDQWGGNVFINIAESENMHTESVLALLDAYGIADPAKTEAGQFSNRDLQALYDQLTAQGSQSLQDAYLVGGAIEEIDILDLETHIAETDRDDIIQVYENLLRGSENHLRAFVRVFENQIRESYRPQYMTQERYSAIVQGENGIGNGAGGQGFGRGNGAGRP